MAKLTSVQPQAGATYYLDTSAVKPLAVLQAGGVLSGADVTRPPLVTGFVASGIRASSRFVVSVLVLEEIAATTRNSQRRDIATKNGHRGDWLAYEKADAQQAAIDLAALQGVVFKMLEHTVTALSSIGVAIEQPLASNSLDAAKEIRRAHRTYLRKYPTLDAMDAMHLAFGAELGCMHFISFDKGWLPVTEITVLGEK